MKTSHINAPITADSLTKAQLEEAHSLGLDADQMAARLNQAQAAAKLPKLSFLTRLNAMMMVFLGLVMNNIRWVIVGAFAIIVGMLTVSRLNTMMDTSRPTAAVEPSETHIAAPGRVDASMFSRWAIQKDADAYIAVRSNAGRGPGGGPTESGVYHTKRGDFVVGRDRDGKIWQRK